MRSVGVVKKRVSVTHICCVKSSFQSILQYSIENIFQIINAIMMTTSTTTVDLDLVSNDENEIEYREGKRKKLY